MRIGARSSPLSRAQVLEVQELIPHPFEVVFVETMGDKDKVTSLRTLGKTDFFTRELDQMVASGVIDAAVHSAKDLPDPLPVNLKIAAITIGVDSRDSLVFYKALPQDPIIGTSSLQRLKTVQNLYPNCKSVDVRGTIHERLQKLDNGEVDAVVIAEAALIRLQLTHLNRIFLRGPTTPLQGKLAIVCRSDNTQALQLFSPIHDPALSRA